MSHELAWAAGFFDGEGCSILHNGRSTVLCSIHQVDRRPLDRFAAAVARGVIRGPIHAPRHKATWAPIHVWVASGQDAVDAIQSMWPWLSAPKREQFMRVWERRKNFENSPRARVGRRRSVLLFQEIA